MWFGKIYSMINPYYALAQNFWFVSPTIYKSRFYKKLIRLNRENIFERNAEPELLWLKDFLPQKAVFIDIGAGWGDYVYWLDYILFPENIHVFEPNKILCKRLKNLFPKINFYQKALSNENKKAELMIPILNKEKIHEESTLLDNITEDEDTKIATQKAECITLDSWCQKKEAEKKELERLDFIKIDTVGQELSVLGGAKETIEKFKPVLMVKIKQKYHSKPIWEIISNIEKYGYSAHYLHRESFSLEPLTENILNSQNAIFAEDSNKFIKNIIFINNR